MTLLDDWKATLKHSWSVKFSIIAAVVGGLESAMQFIAPPSNDHVGGYMAAAAAVISLVGAAARLLAQKELTTVATPGETKP